MHENVCLRTGAQIRVSEIKCFGNKVRIRRWEMNIWELGLKDNEGLRMRKNTMGKVLPVIIDPVMADRSDAAFSPQTNRSNNSILSSNIITFLCLLAQLSLSIALHLGSLKVMHEKQHKA